MTDTEHHRINSLAEKARSVMSNAGQDDHVKQSAVVAKDVAMRVKDASNSVSRKVSQEDAWDGLRGDMELLTEIARAHHALIIDLIDRVAELEARAGTESGGRRSSHSPKSVLETRPTAE